jgi:hypothetical protein
MAGERASLSPSRGKCAEVIALGCDRGAISFFRLVHLTQDNQGFSDGCVLPVVVRLRLANLENGLRNPIGLLSIF